MAHTIYKCIYIYIYLYIRIHTFVPIKSLLLIGTYVGEYIVPWMVRTFVPTCLLVRCVCVCVRVCVVCVCARVYIPLNPLNTRCFCQYNQQVCILYNPVCIFRESGIHFPDAGEDEVSATPLASDCAAEIACPAAFIVDALSPSPIAFLRINPGGGPDMVETKRVCTTNDGESSLLVSFFDVSLLPHLPLRKCG
mmetsp:Transcript_49124/g.79243  ORF Transcript_49124/g.79243 Transcript_49124/m.79243 type:complete len:194 (-) Transcript_49124:4-585(-)